VADGVPQGDSGGRFSDWVDSLKQQWQKFKEAVASQRWVRYFRETVESLKNTFVSLVMNPVVLTLIAGGIVIWMWSRLRRRKQVVDLMSPEHQECYALLKQMDTFVAQFGYEREMSETILQFAQRMTEEGSSPLDGLRNWYMHYSAMRYDPNQSFDSHMHEMSEEFQALKLMDYSSMRSNTM